MLLKYFLVRGGLVGVGGKMNSRIRLTSAKVEVEVDAGLVKKTERETG